MIKSSSCKTNRTALALAAGSLLLASGLYAQEKIVLRGAELFDNGVVPAVIDVDMEDLPAPTEWRPGDPIKEIPQRKGVPRDYVPPVTEPQPAGPSALLELQNRMPQLSGGRAFDAPLVNQDGNGFTGVNPPDTIGDIGNDHYIQMINGNTRVLILDKTDGSQVADFALSSLATGSGTGCTSGSGDPIVMFDETVDNGPGQPTGRWFLSEFTGNSFCVYISQTADPTTGDWFLYEFTSSSGGLPDYPKWAVWPDAYYIGANENGAPPGSGRTVYAFDRENMLQGLTTRPAQVFEVPTLSGFGFQMVQPADWDGVAAPPAGTPGLFFRHRDTEVHGGGGGPDEDFLEIWEFSVDWDSPANSTFTGPTDISVEDFESELCGLTAFACVPQPGSGTQLDPLREPVMWRAQYRNFGGYQAIVATWVTDSAGGAADIHGVRWAELRNTGAGWLLFQEGEVSPDSVNRWMSSIAMDGTGNIALGYNVSDATSTFPGLRYIGRLISDPLDTMPRGENVLVDGSAANNSNRYGDYSSLNVDPVDECTFWFTGEYNTAGQWSTRIGAFRFDACGEPGFALSSSNAVGQVCTLPAPDQFEPVIDVLSISNFTNDVTLSFDPALPTGFGGSFSPNPVAPDTSSTATVTVDQTVAAGPYTLTVLGQASGATDRTLDLALTVFDDLPGAFNLSSPADGAMNASRTPLLEWTASAQVQEYLVEVATDAGFGNVVISELVTGTEFQVGAGALASSTQYFWRVTPGNACGDGTASATFSFTTQPEPGDCPIGATAIPAFSDDMENGANGWTLGAGSVQNTWAQVTDASVSGITSWNAQNVDSQSDQRLVSPSFDLPGAAELPLTLRFWNRQEIEDAAGAACWDGAIVEITTDGGANWTELSDPRVLFREHDGIVNDFTGGPNPLAGLPAWCGDPRDWEDYVIDLSDFAGETVQLRFRLGTDGTVGGRDGWNIDDVRVESCVVIEEEIFADGFESPAPPPM